MVLLGLVVYVFVSVGFRGVVCNFVLLLSRYLKYLKQSLIKLEMFLVVLFFFLYFVRVSFVV